MKSILIFGTIVATVLAVTAWLNGPNVEASDIHEADFFYGKVYASGKVCTLALGDSTVMRSVSNPRWHNFGFSGVGWSDAYLRYAESLLAKDCDAKSILVGITASSLTDKAVADNKFLALYKKSRQDAWFERHAFAVTRHFDPIDLSSLAKKKKKKTYRTVYHDSGWAESIATKLNPDAALGIYTRRFQETKPKDEHLDTLIKHVRRWRSNGIGVFAFRPPFTEKLAAVEDAAGYDETLIEERVRQAGGTWIQIPKGLESYNGTHLTSAAAKELTRLFESSIAASSALER